MALDQEGFRWRNDDGPEEAGSPGATWKASQDTNGVSVGLDTAVRLRVLVNADGAAPETSVYRLEARLVESPDAQWFEVEAPGSPGGDSLIRMKASSYITASGDDTTAQLTPPAGSPKSFAAGRIWDDESGLDGVALANDQYTELEFCVEAVSANGAQAGDVYEFRVTRKAGGAPAGNPNFAFVDSTNVSDDAAGTSFATGAQNVVSGNLLFVAYRWESGGVGDTANVGTPTDTAGNTYVPLGALVNSSGSEDEKISVWYCLAATAHATNVVSATLSASRSFRRALCLQFSYDNAVQLASPTGSGNSATDVAAWSSSPALAQNAGDLIIGAIGGFNSAASPAVPDAPFSSESVPGEFLDVVYYILPSGGSHALSGTWLGGGSDTYVLLTCAFESA